MTGVVTAREMGVNPQTAQHYIDTEIAFEGSDVLHNLSEKLRVTVTSPSEKMK